MTTVLARRVKSRIIPDDKEQSRAGQQTIWREYDKAGHGSLSVSLLSKYSQHYSSEEINQHVYIESVRNNITNPVHI